MVYHGVAKAAYFKCFILCCFDVVVIPSFLWGSLCYSLMKWTHHVVGWFVVIMFRIQSANKYDEELVRMLGVGFHLMLHNPLIFLQ